MVMGNMREWRRIGLSVLAVLAVFATIMAYRAREQPSEGLAAGGDRIETIGDLPIGERSSGPDEPLSPEVLEQEDTGNTSESNSEIEEDGTDTSNITTRISTPRTTDGPTTTTTRVTAAPATSGTTEVPSTVATTATTETTTAPTVAPTAPPTTAAPTTTTTKAPTTTTVPPTTKVTIPPVALTNGGFDASDIPAGSYRMLDAAEVPGWLADNGVLEVWHREKSQVGSGNGNNLLELNSYGPSTVFQRILTTPGSKIRWSFMHRGRSGSDTMEVIIGPVGGPLQSLITVTTGPGWKEYSGTYTIPAGQKNTVFGFRSVTGGSSGNLVDRAALSLA